MFRLHIRRIFKRLLKLFFIFLGIGVLCQVVYAVSANRLKVVSFDKYVEIEYDTPDLEVWEYKGLIDSLYDIPHFYIKCKVPGPYTHGSSVCVFGLVFVEPNLTGYDYAITYAHELTHVKYQTVDDTWVNFKTFKVLYESGSEPLRQIALQFADEQFRGCYDGNYDCAYYIYEYLQDRGVIA